MSQAGERRGHRRERQRAEADVAAATRRACESGADQRGLHAGAVAHRRAHRPHAGDRGRAASRSGQATPLATVQQLDPIYVDITQSSTEMLRLQRQLAQRRARQGREEPGRGERSCSRTAACTPERGQLKFAEVSVDPSTGSVLLRAVFPNPRRELLPGHVRARAAHAGHAIGGAARAAARRHAQPARRGDRARRRQGRQGRGARWSPRTAPSATNG